MPFVENDHDFPELESFDERFVARHNVRVNSGYGTLRIRLASGYSELYHPKGALRFTTGHPGIAYCASPFPNDQFSLDTSTRLMNTSSRRRPSRSCRPSATAL